MRRLVPTDWQKQVKIFEEYGCTFKRQKGDHLVYNYPGAKRAVVIPKYKEISISIIKNNMKTVSMSDDRYFEFAGNV